MAMKRLTIRLLLVALVLGTATASLHAGVFFKRAKREDKPKYPPKYERVSNAHNFVFRDKEGNVQVRKVPSGYLEQFPTPALFYDGYPHSGDDSGLGF